MNFDMALPQTLDEAISANENGARWLAGGTDLVPELKSDLAAPTRLVNLKGVGELRGIHTTGEGIRIGALTTLAEISAHETIRANYRALAQACELSASPQIRNMGTIGGNLCQDSRCAYYRNGFPCFLHGGNTCFARDGENREMAVIGYRDCVHVHPSDPANALVAFDAYILLHGPQGQRRIPAQEFFRAPEKQDTRMNILRDDQMIVGLELPKVSEGTRSAYVKAMDRAVWTFALASAAVRVDIQDAKIKEARVVLGGVAPTPWREFRIEKTLSGTDWNENAVTQGSGDSLEGAEPLAHNRYKIRLARAMVKRALQACWAGEPANAHGV